MEKRGQVTTFMIAGTILVILVISAYLVNEYVIKTALQRQAEKAAKVPEQIKPVKEHLDSCLSFLTSEALKLAGMQGGYINLPSDNLPTNPMVPYSSTLEVFPGMETTYWFYETSNGIQKTQIPELTEIQEEITDYLITNIETCTQGLNEFADQGYNFEIDYRNIKSDVIIKDEAAIASVTIPVKIDYKGLKFDLTNYPLIANLEVPFGRMYKIARGIQNVEEKENFFEGKAFDAMIAFEEIPVSGTEFSCGKKIWNKQEVIQSMKQIIASNMNAIRLKGTYEEKNPDNEYFDLDPGISAKNTRTLFLYSTKWPMIVDVFPSDGDLMTSDQLAQQFSDQISGVIMSILCINNWHFVYDVKFPLLMSLTDPDALDGAGFTFQFADLIIIDNNQPKNNIFGTYNQPEFTFPICKYPNTNVTVYTFAPDENGMLNSLQGVNIKYKCFTTKCEIGITSEDQFAESSITKLFPQCINGLVIGEKQGYYKAEQFASTNQEQVVSLILEPVKKIKVNVKLIEKDGGAIRDPYESESVVFTLKNKDNDFSTSFAYPGIDEIELIPGTYEVKSYVIGNSTWPITIKGRTFDKCVETPTDTVWGVFFKEKKCFETKIDDLVVNEIIKGGAEFEWDISRQELKAKDEITFYTMADKIPGNYESLNLVYSSISKNADSRYFKEPE